MRRILDWLKREIQSISPENLPLILIEPPTTEVAASPSLEQKRAMEDRLQVLLFWWRNRLSSRSEDEIGKALAVNMDGIVFLVEALSTPPGSMAGGLTEAFFIPEKEIKSWLLRAVQEKSQKHKKFRKNPDDCYVIGLAIEDAWTSTINLISLAYGPLIYLGTDGRVRREVSPEYEPKLKEAQCLGWNKLLESASFEVAQAHPEIEQALFLREDFGDVDGILALYSHQVQFVPNPFTGKVRGLRLLDWFPFPQSLFGMPLK